MEIEKKTVPPPQKQKQKKKDKNKKNHQNKNTLCKSDSRMRRKLFEASQKSGEALTRISTYYRQKTMKK